MNKPEAIHIQNGQISGYKSKILPEIETAISTVSDYFGNEKFPFDFSIHLLKTREQMYEVCGFKTKI